MRHKRIWIATCVAALAILAAGTSAQNDTRPSSASKPIALIGGTLIDGTGGPLLRNSVVLIRGDRIERVGTIATLQVPTGYERVSTEGMSVLPGLWDPHVHLIYAGYPNLFEWLKNTRRNWNATSCPSPPSSSSCRV